MRQLTASSANRRISASKLLIDLVATDSHLGSGSESVEVRARSSLVTKHGRIKRATKRIRQATHELVVQARQIATELVREQFDHGQRVRLDLLRAESVVRDRLSVRLVHPVGVRFTSDDRNLDPATRERDLTGSSHDGRVLNNSTPNLVRDIGGQNHAFSCTVNINSSHWASPSKE